MGQPGRGNARSPCGEFIATRSERGEVKHLSTRRKRNQPRFRQERRANADEPKPWVAILTGLWGCSGATRGVIKPARSRRRLERPTREGDSPVDETCPVSLEQFPSTAGHVQSRGKLGGPSSKAKHSLATDSELVP